MNEIRTRSPRRRQATVTIHDVAARAGVSVATVSRVLNGKQLVRPETAVHVLSVARELHFVPNVAARTLSIRRSQTIGIVLPDVHGEFFSEVIRGVDVAARKAGYHILVSGSHSDPGEMMEVLEAMRGRVDGLVVMAPDATLSALGKSRTADLPLVLLNTVDDAHDAITIDNYGGARAMIRHLAQLGHTRIAFIKGPDGNADARERLRGFRHAMRAIPGGEKLELAGDFTERSGYAAALHLCGAADPAAKPADSAAKPADSAAKPAGGVAGATPTGTTPTAIFAANDSMAIGALSALADRGIAVPGEMSVAGFDDIPIAHYVAPPLTTIAVDIAEMGRRAFALLSESLGEHRHPKRQECISTTLVVRKSCAAPHSQVK
ncbi:MAG TPA: LacI family DNA-binding transcriptional regulator [Thermoanaerobaculia bacterium]|nr:LacI family DNA-binding transcriptional regulator [Thermoanaerobaculia bacterium]